MRTRGIEPGGSVLLVERRGEQQLVHNALVVRISMDDRLAGARGEPSITAVFVLPEATLERAVQMPDAVHMTHRDWIEGRCAFAYEELPSPQPGVCRYCGCTENRACPGGCAWMDPQQTACSAEPCRERYMAEAFTPMLELTRV